MNQEEWIDRYRARLMQQVGIGPDYADDCVDAAPFEILAEGFEDDPEGAADEEISCWTD